MSEQIPVAGLRVARTAFVLKLVFVAWLLLLLTVVVSLPQQGFIGVDYLTYARAAEDLARGESPYATAEQSLAVWRSFHRDEAAILDAYAAGTASSLLQERMGRPLQPGPYLYPPTLAWLIAAYDLSLQGFLVLLVFSVIGFGWLWLRAVQRYPWTLLLIMLSWDVLASLQGGNVEPVLLFLSLAATWLLWRGQALVAAPLMALVVLVKPFYLLAFIAFGLLLGVHAPQQRIVIRQLCRAGIAVGSLIGLEALHWGAALRAEVARYYLHAIDHQWFVLPGAEQTPMSDWNRTPLQAFVTAGLSATTAQALALGLWALLLAITAWCLRGRQVSFPLLFALAMILLYLGRPVGWGLVYLDVILIGAAWPFIQRWQKRLVLVSSIALMVSHWWALVLTAQGAGIPFLTLQSASLPWETLIVLPCSWALLISASRRVSYASDCALQRRASGLGESIEGAT